MYNNKTWWTVQSAIKKQLQPQKWRQINKANAISQVFSSWRYSPNWHTFLRNFINLQKVHRESPLYFWHVETVGVGYVW